MKRKVKLLVFISLISMLTLFDIGMSNVYAQTYPCASPSPLPYPESNTCLQAFLAIRPDCCDIDFDITCYTNPNTPGGLLEACDDGVIISGFPVTWENCYDHTLSDGISSMGTNPTCVTEQVSLPPLLFTADAYQCCDANNCSNCYTDCDPPPNSGSCPLAPLFPYDGCLVEVILFDGLCRGDEQCVPPNDPNCQFEIVGGWDVCCQMIYNDLSNGTPPSSFTLNPPDPYTNCSYGAAKPSGRARYPCDDLEPNTIDQCHPVIGCINIPNFANITPAVSIKLWLQGASNSAGTSMASNPSISSSQPFNTAPWNYAGSEGGSVPSNAVDWILLEALNTTTFAVEGQAAGFLLNDGTIRDIDGTTGQIKFQSGTLIATGNYYIAVRTRGHLDVVSATPISLVGSTLYDFTTDASQALNTNNNADLTQMIQLQGTGAPFALYAGDANGDGIINFEDFNDYFLQIGAGYQTADFNHDGAVNGSDFNPYFVENNGRMGIHEIRY